MVAVEQIISKKQFSDQVEALVKDKRMTYMDAVLHLCGEKMIDPLDVAGLVSASIKERIESEAIASKMIQGKNTLPL
jgi:hypothetical protein